MGYEEGKFSVSSTSRSALLGIFKLRSNPIIFTHSMRIQGRAPFSLHLLYLSTPMAALAGIFRRRKSSLSGNFYVKSHAVLHQCLRCPFRGLFIPRPLRLNPPPLPSNSSDPNRLNTLSRLSSAANTSLHHATSLLSHVSVTSKSVTSSR